MLDKVKLALRISTDAFDDEITDLIDAAKMDLQLSGVKTDNAEKDSLLQQAIFLYCKSMFGLGNPDKAVYWESYQSMLRKLKLSSDYGMHETEAEV